MNLRTLFSLLAGAAMLALILRVDHENRMIEAGHPEAGGRP